MQSVGVIGAGRMGLPIVGHLVRKGFEVWATDIDGGKKAAVEERGGHFVASAAEVSRHTDVVLVALGYDRQVQELLEAPGGLFETSAPDTIIAILSTVSPESVQRLAEAGSRARVHVVDSTVCRGSWAADAGTLLSFVAGDEAIVARLEPIVRAYSSDVAPTGRVGSAQVAKAVNNLILWATLVADHEGLALADLYGLDVEPLRKALLISSATNGALQDWGKQTMAWAADDMEIVVAMAEEKGISLPQVGLNREICRTLKPRRYKLDAYGR